MAYQRTAEPFLAAPKQIVDVDFTEKSFRSAFASAITKLLAPRCKAALLRDRDEHGRLTNIIDLLAITYVIIFTCFR
jgi:hypothetical protein